MHLLKQGKNICHTVIPKQFCSGCGACVGVCPVSCLSIDFNVVGQYEPVMTGNCTGCDLCLKVCPFMDGNPDENELGKTMYANIPEIKYHPDCGYYLKSFVGYNKAKEQRINSASGGLATWTLETLLKQGVVDKVIAVKRCNNPNKLFEFVVCDSVDEVRACSGSAYYPVEMSEVIRYVFQNDGRYAVIGLPCFIKALRLASNHMPKLDKRLVFFAGLLCETLHSQFFTEYLVAVTGGKPDQVQRAFFRRKNPDLTAREYSFEYYYGSEIHEPQGNVVVGRVCGQGRGSAKWFFKLNSCNYCDDAFSELADVVFMDAWSPEYEVDPMGTNFLIARTPLALDLLQSGRQAGELSIEEMPIEKVIMSQSPVLKAKRQGLAIRLRLKHIRKESTIIKRVPPAAKLRLGDVISQHMLLKLQADAHRVWAKNRGQNLEMFYRKLPLFRFLIACEKCIALRNRILGGMKKRICRVLSCIRVMGRK